MDEHRDEVRFEPVSSKGVSRAVPILTFLVGIFLGAAVVKPWDLVFPPPPRSAVVVEVPTSTARSSTGPTPVASSTPAPAVPAECVFAGGWRVFALGQRDALGGDGSTGGGVASSPPGAFGDIGNPLRRWLEVPPLTDGTGPGDARIPFVTIVSVRTTGIGYCPPPGGGDEPPKGSQLQAWSVGDGSGATALTLQRVSLAVPMALDVAVYIPAGEDATGAGRWAPGRYVFAVASPDGAYSRWFGVEIRTPPGKPPA